MGGRGGGGEGGVGVWTDARGSKCLVMLLKKLLISVARLESSRVVSLRN